MTIEERADAYVGHPEEIDEFTSATIKREAYIRGAKEQKAIDDAECVNQVIMGKGSAINHYKQGYHDAVDKFCELLKHNWREYVYQDRDGIVYFGHWEADMRRAMEE